MVAEEGKQGPTGNRQAGRQQEERVEGQPRDDEDVLLEATATKQRLDKEI